ncbi:MAG: PPOX class F420-dependent oxidoreductase [Phycicoccus sp.]
MTASDDAGSAGAGRRHPLADERFVSLTTFRKTGVPVSSPVWIAVDGSDPAGLVVITVDHTGKTKRLAHTPAVELRPCDRGGGVAPDAPRYRGTARVSSDPAEVYAVRQVVNAKYGALARLLDVGTRIGRTVGVVKRPRAGIFLDLEPEPVAPTS